VPEELKPRRIQIGSGAQTSGPKSDNPPKRIEGNGKKAA